LYRMLVTWSQSPVYETVLALRSDIDNEVVALVYHAPFRAIDSRGVALEGATLQVTNSSTARPMGTRTTDTTGTCLLRLPIGSYFVNVTWQDTNVFLSRVTVDGNDAIVLHVAVYYFTFHIVDGDSLDLGNARLVVVNSTTSAVLGTLTTPDNGTVDLRLPQGEIAFDVWWMTVKVNSSAGVGVHANGLLLVKARVYHLTVRVIGSDGAAVRGAKVLVERGVEVWSAATTDKAGEAKFRLPGGSYSVNMTFKATYYMTRILVSRIVPVGLTQSMTVEIKLKDSEYPIPWYRTTLFSVIFAYVLSFVVLILVFWLILRRYGERARPADEGKAPAEEGEGKAEDEAGDKGSGKGEDKGEDNRSGKGGDKGADESSDDDDIDELIRDTEGKDKGK